MYRLFDVPIKPILESEDFEHQEDTPHDGANRHSVLGVEVKEAVDLTACVEVEFHDGVVPIEVDELLEEKR